MDTPPNPPAKKPKAMSAETPQDEGNNIGTSAELLHFAVRKSTPGSVPVDVAFPETSTLGDLAAHLARQEDSETTLLTIVCKGKVLNDLSAALKPLVETGSKTVMVYIVRKPVGPTAAASPGASSADASPAAPAKTVGAAPQSQSQTGVAAAPPQTAASPALEANAVLPTTASTVSSNSAFEAGHRVLLLLRHGQCCYKDEHDEMKALTASGHQQANESARYVAQLLNAGLLPQQRALLHSTSRRARETAAKLPQHLPGITSWNADLLRETDPTNNPLRAEEVFQRLFAAPAVGAADTLIVVAHNNIILYWLMRAAGVPVERASQAWNLFQLRHASVTRVDVAVSGDKRIVCIGAAGHIPHDFVTWNNIPGADMAAWKGTGAERRKFSGRMLILVRQVEANAKNRMTQIEATAAHIRGLSEYMVSGHMSVAYTSEGRDTATAIAQMNKSRSQLLPESVWEEPEAVFLQYFCATEDRGRDTVVLVTEHFLVLYWLLRSLHMSPEEAKTAIHSYNISQGSVTLLNIRSDRSMKAVVVGDTGHLPVDCLET